MNANTITPGPVFGRRDPDPRGYFGRYGGRFAPETLMAPLDELRDAYFALRRDDAFRAELVRLLVTFAGRPTPLYEARRLAAEAGGAVLLCGIGSRVRSLMALTRLDEVLSTRTGVTAALAELLTSPTGP